MKFDINEVPFSMRGSYMAISYMDRYIEEHKRLGIYLRNIHGNIKIVRDRCVGKIEPTYNGKIVQYTYEAAPHQLKMITDYGSIKIYYSVTDTILIRA